MDNFLASSSRAEAEFNLVPEATGEAFSELLYKKTVLTAGQTDWAQVFTFHRKLQDIFGVRSSPFTFES